MKRILIGRIQRKFRTDSMRRLSFAFMAGSHVLCHSIRTLRFSVMRRVISGGVGVSLVGIRGADASSMASLIV